MLIYRRRRTFDYLTKRFILAARLCPGRASGDGYITVPKIQTGICKNGRKVKLESS